MIVVSGFNFLGDGLRDVLDPRARPGWHAHSGLAWNAVLWR